jgi:hypothetical protein
MANRSEASGCRRKRDSDVRMRAPTTRCYNGKVEPSLVTGLPRDQRHRCARDSLTPTSPPDDPKCNRTNTTRCRRYLGKPSSSWRKFSWHPGASLAENLGIRHQCHSHFLEAGNPVHIRYMYGHTYPNAASCRVRGIAMEPQGGPPVFQPGSGQWSGGTCIVRGNGDGPIGEPAWSGK